MYKGRRPQQDRKRGSSSVVDASKLCICHICKCETSCFLHASQLYKHTTVTLQFQKQTARKKVMLLVLKVILRLLNSFEIIFRQETSTALQRKPAWSGRHRGEFQGKCFLVYLSSEKSFPTLDEHTFYDFVSRTQNEWGILSFVHWKYRFQAPVRAPCLKIQPPASKSQVLG